MNTVREVLSVGLFCTFAAYPKYSVMPDKTYKAKDNLPETVSEPAETYRSINAGTSSSDDDTWNPNVPFCGTQEEWWEHFHRIEEGEFYTLEEADEEFEAWKKEFLASRL
jgi:hypothetical protein